LDARDSPIVAAFFLRINSLEEITTVAERFLSTTRTMFLHLWKRFYVLPIEMLEGRCGKVHLCEYANG
jgi:hypothetical protein